MTELIFEVREDRVDGGYSASALCLGIHTQGATVEQLRTNVREAVDCYFDESMEGPNIIRLHFVRSRKSEDLSWTPKTPLGRKLLSLRNHFIATGGELLNREGIAAELRSRRGGYD